MCSKQTVAVALSLIAHPLPCRCSLLSLLTLLSNTTASPPAMLCYSLPAGRRLPEHAAQKNNATITDALFPSAKDAGRLPDEGEQPGESKRRV